MTLDEFLLRFDEAVATKAFDLNKDKDRQRVLSFKNSLYGYWPPLGMVPYYLRLFNNLHFSADAACEKLELDIQQGQLILAAAGFYNEYNGEQKHIKPLRRAMCAIAGKEVWE